MKLLKAGVVVFTFSLFTTLFACDANCLACHPKLAPNGKYDNNHKILKRCTNCHTQDPNEEDHGACGADCWECHDIQKVGDVNIPEHKVLAKCIKCHESVDKHLFEKGANPLMRQGSLLDTLEGGN